MYFDVTGLRNSHIFPGGFGSFEYMDPIENEIKYMFQDGKFIKNALLMLFNN